MKLVKIDLSEGADDSTAEAHSCASSGPGRNFRKMWKFMRWLAQYDLYPLLSLNFFFRFAFAAYKSVFAFFCMGVMHYGADQVGYLLSAMGLGGMFVQGVLVRVVVGQLGEERTLVVAMICTAGGFILLSFVDGLPLLVVALTSIAIGYGLTVPCLTTLFSHVPVEQGVMQGIAGAIDRFGQAFGPVVGGSLLHLLGEAALMRWTGLALAAISACCLACIGDGCYSWMRELCFHPAAGYSKVNALDAIDEEEDEEATNSSSSSNCSSRVSPTESPRAAPTPGNEPDSAMDAPALPESAGIHPTRATAAM